MVLDNAQLNKDSYQRRNVFLANGKEKHLTIPIDYRLGVKINDAKIKDSSFPEKHYDKLRNWYLKSDFFNEIENLIRSIYSRRYKNLISILNETIFTSLQAFGVKKEVIFSSELNGTGTKADLVLSICRALKADIYLSGRGATAYFQDKDYLNFKKAGIEIIFQEFVHPTYKQFNSEEFISGLGCLDILFNCGVAQSRRIFQETIGE